MTGPWFTRATSIMARKTPVATGEARRPQAGDEVLVEAVRLLGGGRLDVRGPAPPARVTEERELGDDEEPARDVEHRAVHLARLVGEDTEVEDLVREGLGVRFRVPHGDSEQDDEAGADRPTVSPPRGPTLPRRVAPPRARSARISFPPWASPSASAATRSSGSWARARWARSTGAATRCSTATWRSRSCRRASPTPTPGPGSCARRAPRRGSSTRTSSSSTSWATTRGRRSWRSSSSRASTSSGRSTAASAPTRGRRCPSSCSSWPGWATPTSTGSSTAT